MQQIADWLRTLGMSEYAQRFAENDIDFAVLPHLTDQASKGTWGVLRSAIGVKLLRAIAELNGIQKGAVQRLASLVTEVPSPRTTPPSAARSR